MSDLWPRQHAAQAIERLKAGATEDEALAPVPEHLRALTLAHIEAARNLYRAARVRRVQRG